MKFEGEEVEIDGVKYTVSGAYQPEYDDLICLDVRTPSNVVNHLMDSVVEDLMTELVLRITGKDEFFVEEV